MSIKLQIGICLIIAGGLSFCAALATADWRWLLVTAICCLLVHGR